MTAQTETHRFEAVVQEVLSLVIHSLYTNKEVFLRELISNCLVYTSPSPRDRG